MMKIRQIDLSDLHALQQISKDTFMETFAESNTPEDMQNYLNTHFSIQQLQAELSNINSRFYFVEQEKAVLGYLKLNFGDAQSELQDHKAVEIERIYVSLSSQGNGIGQMLFNYAIEIAYHHHAPYIWLGVWEHNQKAIDFYHKNGFEQFGTHIFRLGDDEQTDWLMKLILS